MGSREEFIQQCLKRSNFHRSNHGVEALSLNRELCVLSQGWAEVLARRGGLQHNTNARYKGDKVGENIAYSYNSQQNPTGDSMIDQWYNEVEKYNFRRQGFSSGTGHFTQLVWRGSKEVGFGLAIKNGEHYLVANYYPAGNFIGEFEKNVFAKGSKPTSRGADGGVMSCSGSDPKPKKSLFGGFFSNDKQKFDMAGSRNASNFREDGGCSSGAITTHRGSPMAFREFDTEVDSNFGDFSNVRSFNSSGFDKNHNDYNNNKFSKNFNSNNIKDSDSGKSTTTTVETKIENGLKITTTTTVTKTSQGTTTQTSTRKEYI